MLGVLTTQEPTAFFHIISKDQGFQPLVKTLRARKLHVYLCPALAEIPCLKSGSPKAAPVVAPATVPKPASTHKNKPAKPAMKAVPADMDRALAHLELIRKARPRKMTTLKTSLISHFKATHDDQRINHLIEALLHGSKISHDEKGALTYNI